MACPLWSGCWEKPATRTLLTLSQVSSSYDACIDNIFYHFRGQLFSSFIRDSNSIYFITAGTLWNLSSHDSVKMEIVDHALHALADEVIVPHSGWERGSNGGEESCKPRHLEWETALTNTAGCLRYSRRWMDGQQEERLILRRKHAIMCLTFLSVRQECEFRTQRGPAKAEGVHRNGWFTHVHCPITDQPQRCW